MSYAVVTPVRNEQGNLERLAASLAAQSCPPVAWVVVDTGSTDGTPALAARLAAGLPWVRTAAIEGAPVPVRGAPIVRAFTAGARLLDPQPDVVVKVDADLSFPADHFARLLEAFHADGRLGIASGVCTELRDGAWRPIYGTRSHVWGAARAYRWACLQQVLPLEERQGWDEIDAIKAQLHGWRVGALLDLPFRHHRPEGERDGARRRWADQGDTAHFMGYRLSYLLARAAFRSLRDPRSLAMLEGYARAALERRDRVSDPAVIAHLRREQDPRRLPLRLREVLGRAG